MSSSWLDRGTSARLAPDKGHRSSKEQRAAASTMTQAVGLCLLWAQRTNQVWLVVNSRALYRWISQPFLRVQLELEQHAARGSDEGEEQQRARHSRLGICTTCYLY